MVNTEQYRIQLYQESKDGCIIEKKRPEKCLANLLQTILLPQISSSLNGCPTRISINIILYGFMQTPLIDARDLSCNQISSLRPVGIQRQLNSCHVSRQAMVSPGWQRLIQIAESQVNQESVDYQEAPVLRANLYFKRKDD